MAKENVAYCPKCAWPMGQRDAGCSSCGYEIPPIRTRPFQYTLRDFFVLSLAAAIVGILYRSYAENDRRNNAAIATVMNSSSSVIVLRDEIVLIIHDHNSNTVAEAIESLGRLTSHNTSVDRLTVQGGTLDATAIKKLVDTRGIIKLQLDSSIVSDAAWNNLESLDNTLIDLRLVNLKLSEFAARHIATLKCLKSIEAVETDLWKSVRDYLRRVRPDVTVDIGPKVALEQGP